MTETLYLIDGHAQIFRAYYAIRGGMRSPVTSEPTHAVFGFTGMLIKLLSQLHPQYVAVAVDMPGPTFRDTLFAEYKGTREATPDDLKAQIPRILETVELFGLPVVGVPGLEADDVIATITQRVLDDPSCSGINVRIVSRDKDLEQLLGDRVTLFDIHTDSTIDAASLMETKGVRPDQVIDLLALTGDTVDNVPGVAGVGPKTAAKLIQQYGCIEGIYEHIHEIKGKMAENLCAGQANLPLSRSLVALKRDADFPFSLDAARIRPVNVGRLLPLFQQLGFNRYQDDVRKLAGVGSETLSLFPAFEAPPTKTENPEPPQPAGDTADLLETEVELDQYHPDAVRYRLVHTRQGLEELALELRSRPIVSVDTETTSLRRDARLCGLSFSWASGEAVYVPTLSPQPENHLTQEEVLSILRPVLEDPAVPKCGHNVKFDAGVLLRCGVRLQGVCFDTMLASTLTDPGQSAQLDSLTTRLLRYRMIPISDLIGSGEQQLSIDRVSLEQVVPYAAEDADFTLRLYHELRPRVESQQMLSLLEDVEAPLTVVLSVMEHNGICCDPAELDRQGSELQVRAAELRGEIQKICGCEFHVDSPRQLADVLFDKLGLASGKKTKMKTARSTDIEVLERLAAQEDQQDPRTSVPRLIIEYRQLTKLIGTYMGNLKESINKDTGRIHTTFHQLVTATGRLASNGPNLQNIPVRTDIGRQIRKAFPAAPGCSLICADYSQIELRLLAHLSEDPALLDAFARDEDIHTAVASQVFSVPMESVTRAQRSQAKTINFGIIYGVSAFGLSRRVEGMSVAEARTLIEDYRRRFSGIDRFLGQCVHQAMESGYVSTILGRRRQIPELHSSNPSTRSLGERLAINSVVQGSAADLIKVAMVHVYNRIYQERLALKLLLQIHDELVLETPQEHAESHAAIVREEMEHAMRLKVPLKAEAGIGPDWMTAK